MRKLYVYTDLPDDLLNIELDVIKHFNIQPNENYSIDVFDEKGNLITTLHNIQNPQ
jgi:hypothetical protein